MFSWLSGSLLLSGFLLPSVRLAVSHAAVSSAITADGTLGTRVTQSGTAFTISGGTIAGAISFIALGALAWGRAIAPPSLAHRPSPISWVGSRGGSSR